jgi:Helix-turn-helix domain
MSLRMMTLVWEKSNQKGSELLLLLAIADNANDQGIAYPSTKTLAKKTRLDRRHVKKLIRALERTGELRVAIGAGPRGCNEYVIQLSTEGGGKMPPRMKSTGGIQDQKGVSPTPPEPNTKTDISLSLTETDLKRLGLTPGSTVWKALLGSDEVDGEKPGT